MQSNLNLPLSVPYNGTRRQRLLLSRLVAVFNAEREVDEFDDNEISPYTSDPPKRDYSDEVAGAGAGP